MQVSPSISSPACCTPARGRAMQRCSFRVDPGAGDIAQRVTCKSRVQVEPRTQGLPKLHVRRWRVSKQRVVANAHEMYGDPSPRRMLVSRTMRSFRTGPHECVGQSLKCGALSFHFQRIRWINNPDPLGGADCVMPTRAQEKGLETGRHDQMPEPTSASSRAKGYQELDDMGLPALRLCPGPVAAAM